MQDEFRKLLAEEEDLVLDGGGRYLAMANEIIEANDRDSKQAQEKKADYTHVLLYDMAQTLRALLLLQGAQLDLQEKAILLGAEEKGNRS